MKKNWWRFAVLFIITLVFLYFFLKNVEWNEVLGHLTNVNLKFFILWVLLIPTHLITRAIRWQYLLNHEKKGISFYRRFAATAIGFTVTWMFPGRLGEIARPLYLAQRENMRKGFVLGTAVVERIFDIFTMCMILGLFLISKPLYASIFHIDEVMYSRLYFWGIVGIVFASIVLFFILGLYFFREKTLRVIGFLLRPLPKKFSAKILELIEEFIQGLKFFHSFGNFVVFVIWSFIVWLGIIFFYWIFFFAYNINITFFFLFPYCFMLMVGASIPTPGMIGGFDYFSKLGLTSFYRIDPNLAFSMTLVVHTLQVVVTCLIGYIILWKEGISLLQIKKIGEVTD